MLGFQFFAGGLGLAMLFQEYADCLVPIEGFLVRVLNVILGGCQVGAQLLHVLHRCVQDKYGQEPAKDANRKPVHAAAASVPAYLAYAWASFASYRLRA